MAPTICSCQLSATPFVILAQLFAIGLTTLVLLLIQNHRGGFSLKSKELQYFNLHPFLMLIGIILAGGEAMMAFKTFPTRNSARRVLHLILHLSALTAGIVGICVIFRYQRAWAMTNLQTLHSWLGIITICLYIAQWVFAFFAYFFLKAEKSTRAALLPCHVFFGMVTFLLAVLTAETGLSSLSPLRLKIEGYMVNFIGLLLLLFAISVILAVILPRRY